MNGASVFGASKTYTDQIVGGVPGIFIGYVTNAFPTTRQDGTPLLVGDYVRALSSLTFPVIINGIKFNTNKDRAIFEGSNKWQIETYIYQNTKETVVTSKISESISGSSKNQKELNEETKTNITEIKSNFIDERLLDLAVKDIINNKIVDAGNY